MEEVLELAAALEVQSEHPLAAAVLACAAERLGHAPRADKGARAHSRVQEALAAVCVLSQLF